MANIQVFENLDDINLHLLDLFTKISNVAIEKNGFFSLALSGGSTPLFFYQELSKHKNLNWDKTHIFFVDERFVSDTDEKSNVYQINKYLIKPLNLKKENIHYINKDLDIEDATKEYELDVKSLYHTETPSFDLILLGIGTDGHTASLFPNQDFPNQDFPNQDFPNQGLPNRDLSKEKEKLIVLSSKEDEPFERISFSYPLINNAKNVLFLTTGENKASIIKRILINKDRSLPASHIKAKDNLYFILDKKAARFIDL